MPSPVSSLLLYERFEAGDDRFLDELFALTAQGKLKAFAERWLGDARPFARSALLRYIDDGCDRPGHRVLVKALLRGLEASGDDEAMGHFMVAFDRLLKRRLVRLGRRYDEQGGRLVLMKPADVPVHAPKTPSAPAAPGAVSAPGASAAPAAESDPARLRFSMRTRMYLCRRAFRYFRQIGRTDKARYGRAIRAALALYDDANLQRPEQLLDAWGLLNAIYWGSSGLQRRPRGAGLAHDRALADLEPAPIFYPEAWAGDFEGLFALLERARSRVVRAFAIWVLEREYAESLRGMPARRIRPLLASPHEEIQSFAAGLLRTSHGMDTLTAAEWLDFLRIESPVALLFLCDLIRQHVSPGRLTLEQCVDLARARAAPVAELGLEWARRKPIQGEAAVRAIVGLGSAEAPRVREEGVLWVTQVIEKSPHSRPEHLRDLLDAKHEDTRRHALAAMKKTLRFKESTELWAALSESPYDDVRSFLVAHLTVRQGMYSADALRHLWATALLAIHRGSRDKREVIGQIADRVVASPAEADALLPLLGVALRSVREPERRAAIAALARAAYREPLLRHAIAARLPELKLSDDTYPDASR